MMCSAANEEVEAQQEVPSVRPSHQTLYVPSRKM